MATGGVAVGPAGNRLVTTGHDQTTRIWTITSTKPPLPSSPPPAPTVGFRLGATLSGHIGHVQCIRRHGQAVGPEDRCRGRTARPPRRQRAAQALPRSAGAGADIPIWLLVGSPHSVAYSPDGARLAVACGTNGILLFDLDTGDQLGRLPVNDGHHLVAQEAVAFSADDTLLVAVCADQTIRRWGTDTGAEIRRSAMDPYFGTRSVAFSPDGGRLAVACRDRTVRLWDLVPAVGDHPAGR
jgi:WD40 repeat protein